MCNTQDNINVALLKLEGLKKEIMFTKLRRIF